MMYGGQVSGMDSMFQLAQQNTVVFNLVAKLFLGQVDEQNKDFVKPTRMTKFLHMTSKLSDEEKVVLLSQVIMGTLSLTDFDKKCVFWIRTKKLQTKLLNDLGLATWEAATEMYPFLHDKALVEKWVNNFDSLFKKGNVPKSWTRFVNQIQLSIDAADVQRKAALAELDVVCTTFSFRLCDYVLHNKPCESLQTLYKSTTKHFGKYVYCVNYFFFILILYLYYRSNCCRSALWFGPKGG